jgi:hypothetical protein
MKPMRKVMQVVAFASLVVCLLFLTACEREITGDEADYVLSISDPMMENLVLGLASNDYTEFSSDFDPFMQASIPADDFPDFKQEVDSQLGNYLSREVQRVAQSDEYYVVDYRVKFEQAEPVTVGFAFHINQPQTINHLWVNTDQQSWAPEPPR